VLATGITPRKVASGRHPKVVSYLDVLNGRVTVGAKVAIIGAGGIGFDVAEFLVKGPSATTGPRPLDGRMGRGSRLRDPGGLVPAHPRTAGARGLAAAAQPGKPGARLGKTTGWIHRATLKAKGVQMLGGVEYLGIDDAGPARPRRWQPNRRCRWTTWWSAPARNRAATAMRCRPGIAAT
jgi:2,4-dienoyl-CoA reductase (NADPH2)